MRSFPHHWPEGPRADKPGSINGDRQQPNSGGSRPRSWLKSAGLWLALCIAALANIAAWTLANPAVNAPDAPARFSGVAYNAFGRWDNPVKNKFPGIDRVRKDMALLAERTGRLRTYSSAEFPQLPAIAAEHDIKITAGVWLDRIQATNEKEVQAIGKAVQTNRNIERVVVGNETLLHGLVTVEELVDYLNRVRARVSVPISTAEPWHIWLRYPKIAEHVDYILVHLLPYWEGVPHTVAVDYAMRRYQQMRERFPGKHIVVGEIGWPSNGDRFRDAHAGQLAQAQFMREFLARVQGSNLDYFVMEAIDQPWKLENEGRVGSYWGLMDAYRSDKFAFQGPLFADPQWMFKAFLAGLLGILAAALALRRLRHMRTASKVFLAGLIQACASLTVWLVAVPMQHYLRWMDWLALVILAPTLLMMLCIVLANGIEFAEMFWRGNLRKRAAKLPVAKPGAQPFVSVHLACCNEPPDMVIATIKSLVALDYSNFEVIVVDNNTQDEALWRPVEQFMAGLGDNFQFFHLPQWPGFKAGALNFALEQTDPRAEVIGVVDADYVVDADWLSSLTGGFADSSVAVIQSPQAHRNWRDEFFRRMMNWEFDGFFRIGMHHRHERNAIIQHGTMTLVRADALRELQWCTQCICEDAELGLRLMKRGSRIVYIDKVFGRGLTADNFAAFRKQRHRWAQGAMQIMRLHRGPLFTGREDREGRLSTGQRYHFIAGWMSWFGDAMHLLFAMAAMLWTVGILLAPQWFSYPILLFMLPVFAFFLCKTLLGPLLFWRRVGCSLFDVFGAALAGMALSHGIARGVIAGLSRGPAVFRITDKAGSTQAQQSKSSGHLGQLGQLGQVREELFLLTGLLACLFGLALTRETNHFESTVWMMVLALQALPYLAALAFVLISLIPREFQAWLSGSVNALSSAASKTAGAAAPLTASRWLKINMGTLLMPIWRAWASARRMVSWTESSVKADSMTGSDRPASRPMSMSVPSSPRSAPLSK